MRLRALLLAGLTSLAFAAMVEPATPAVATLTKPNILLVLTDDQTYDALQPGNPVVMPTLEGWLNDPNDHWIQFDNFFFNNPLCCPSRATILTGQYSHHTGVETNTEGKQLDESSTIATWLDAAGYRTGLIGKYLNDYPFGRGDYKPPGWDYFDAHTGKGNLGYYDYTLWESLDGSSTGTRTDYKFGANDYSTTVLTQKMQSFIDATPSGTPFFGELSLAAAHGDWKPDASKGYDNLYPGLIPNQDPSFNEADVSDKPAWVQALPQLDAAGIAASNDGKIRHYETLRSVDDAMANLKTTLVNKGVWDNTIIIFMTDNGYSFSDNRWEGKRCEYDSCLRSPFLVRYPGATAGVDHHLVSNVDVAPTLAALGGATPTIPVDGASFVPFLTGSSPPSWRTGVLIHNHGDGSDVVPTWWGVRTANYAYVELAVPAGPAPNVELYDLTGQHGAPDPWELQNRADDPTYAAVRAQLAEQLAELQVVDLTTTIDDAPDPVNAGAKLTYTVTVRDAGLGSAYGVSLSNPLPQGVALVSVTPSQGSCDATISCSLGTIPAGKKAVVTIVVRPSVGGTLTDTATATGTAPDPTPGNATATSSTTVIQNTNDADVSVTLGHSPEPVPMGGKLNFTAKISNAGPDTATGVSLTTAIPATTTYVSAKPGSECAFSSGTVTCSIGSLTAGNSTSVTITVTPNVIGSVTDTVNVSATSHDPDTADLHASSTATVTDPNADLAVTIADAPDPIGLGAGNVSYAIVTTNNGPAQASRLRVVDTLPANFTFVSSKPATKCSYASHVVTCSLGSLASGGSIKVTIVATPTTTGTFTDTVTVSSSAPDPNTANNSRSEQTTVG